MVRPGPHTTLAIEPDPMDAIRLQAVGTVHLLDPYSLPL